MRKSFFSDNSKIQPYFDKKKPETFENSLIPRYKLKIKTGFIFDCGRFFCILLDFSVHLLLRCRDRTPVRRSGGHIRQRRCSVASLDVENLQREQRGPRLLRSKHLGAVMCLDSFQQSQNEAVMERPAPSRVAIDEISTQQGNQLIVTAHIENAGKSIQRKTKLPKDTMELGRFRRDISGKIVRSVALNENSSNSLTKSHKVTHGNQI